MLISKLELLYAVDCLILYNPLGGLSVTAATTNVCSGNKNYYEFMKTCTIREAQRLNPKFLHSGPPQI